MLLQQAVGRATRRSALDGPDDLGTVVLMVHVDIDKYRACRSDKERNAALRQDMSSGSGDFTPVADFLLALQQEDPSFLQELIAGRGRASQPAKRGGRAARKPAATDDAVAQERQRQFEFDFSQAAEFKPVFSLADAQTDDGDASEGSAFLQNLALSTPALKRQLMLLQKPQQQQQQQQARQQRKPAAAAARGAQHKARHVPDNNKDDDSDEGSDKESEPAQPRQRPATSAGARRTSRRVQAGSDSPDEGSNSVGDGASSDDNSSGSEDAVQPLELLREFVKFAGRLPHDSETWRGLALGAWCSSRRAEYSRGTLSAGLAKQLREIDCWEWGQQQRQLCLHSANAMSASALGPHMSL
jgi:hypothetical protein